MPTRTGHPTACELVAALAAGEVSARELALRYLERIEEVNPALNAAVHVDAERTLADAEAADAALARGERRLLLGLPVSIKDSVAVAIARAVWPVRSASVLASAERCVRRASTTAPRTWRVLPSNGDCRRPDGLAVRPAARNRQWDASGQSSHRGAGRQYSRPRSINAWFHSPGADGSSHACASRASRSGATSCGSAPWIARAATLPTFVSIAARGWRWPIDATAAAV